MLLSLMIRINMLQMVMKTSEYISVLNGLVLVFVGAVFYVSVLQPFPEKSKEMNDFG